MDALKKILFVILVLSFFLGSFMLANLAHNALDKSGMEAWYGIVSVFVGVLAIPASHWIIYSEDF